MPETSNAETLLRLLAVSGIRHLFGNAGTDAAPLIEAYARMRAAGDALFPEPVVVPHEMAAVSIAHGRAMVAGEPSAVFVHTTVGTANAATGIMNAFRQRVPMLVLAGRTPVLEHGPPGARDLYIHWAQESYDQAAPVREYVKWDYELRDPRQLPAVVARALALATTSPMGPVYLALPREVLAAPSAAGLDPPPPLAPPVAVPDPAAVAEAADLIAAAEHPVAVANAAGRDPGAVAALVRLAEAAGMGVVEFFRERMNFPADHPHHLGFWPQEALEAADLVVVVESDVPWLPQRFGPPPAARVVHIGEDPLFATYPMRTFRADVTLAGSPRHSLAALAAAVADRAEPSPARGDELARLHRAARAAAAARAGTGERPVAMARLSRLVAQAAGPEAIYVNEYDLHSDQLDLTRPGSYFGAPSVSGLGWGLGAALGAAFAAPDRQVVCAVGDGAFVFANPVACLMTAARLRLGVLVVVFDNGRWEAVRQSVRDLAPAGWAQRGDDYPLTSLEPSPDYGEVARACGAHGERVEDPADIPAALQRALAVTGEGRPAVVDVVCA